ncbi:unnamed protein product [Schistocephalus solidus]|uniref:HSF_DOMAIN domain-containing protein n=1 Tax=Schistocephalus solidus TaxID=70667 RepID=A0A183SKD8_SCHSO|nr:unnamed protein product [Schistocephalus solidus]
MWRVLLDPPTHLYSCYDFKDHEISCLQHDCSILTSKNDALISQLTEMRQILIDAGVSPTVPCETESNGVDAGPVSHPFGLPDSPERDIDTPPTANQKIL